MVKLIRLKANANTNNTEINNTFKQPLIIQPNSKIALAGLDVHLRDITKTEEFPIASPDNTLKVDGTTLTLTPATYTLSDLQQESVGQMGLNAVSWRLADEPTNRFPGGMNYQLQSDDSKFTFTKFKSPLRPAEVGSEYFVATGYATTIDTLGGGTITGDADSDDALIASDKIVPNGSFRIEFNVNRSATQGNNAIEWSVRPDERWDEIVVACGINAAGNYYTVFNNDNVAGKTVVPGPIASELNDQITITRAGTEITIEIRDVDGVLKHTAITYALTSDMWNSYWAFSHCKYICEIPQGSLGSLSKIQTTGLDLDFRTGLGSSSTTLTLEFLSELLALYFGWKTKGPFMHTADPAKLTSPGIISGENSNPGIMVTVDPFILDSYDGSDTSKFQSNILYVIHDTSAFSKNVSMEINPHIALDIRNENAMLLNQLRVTFRDVNGNPFKFLGLPLVTLVIYGPDE